MAYATETELSYLGLPASILDPIAGAAKTAGLDAASDIADSYLRKRYTLPLSAYGSDIKRAVCAIAGWILLSSHVGFNPEADSDRAVRQAYLDAIAWLESVAKGSVDPAEIVDATPTTAPRMAEVWSDTGRGWDRA
jgi:phage gp36-like protein